MMQAKNVGRKSARWILAASLSAALVATAGTASAQEMLQLTVPASEYSLGGFQYKAPKDDGWRQMSSEAGSLSLVYAEQKTEDSIETRFGAAFEVHGIPEGVAVEGAAALADLSRKQMAEARTADLVALSGIEPVPSMDNLYTYRLLVKPPVADMPNAYEVYYVAMAPDKSQYLVIQAITKTQEYANDLYFQQFYGSLASLKFVGGGAPVPPSPTIPAETPETETPGTKVPGTKVPETSGEAAKSAPAAQ